MVDTTQDGGAGDLSAVFRQKAAYMKTWKPASIPSVSERSAAGSLIWLQHADDISGPIPLFFLTELRSPFSKLLFQFLSRNDPRTPPYRTAIGWNCTRCTSRPFRVTPPPSCRRSRAGNAPSSRRGRASPVCRNPRRCASTSPRATGRSECTG